jgi:hypothetical protein
VREALNGAAKLMDQRSADNAEPAEEEAAAAAKRTRSDDAKANPQRLWTIVGAVTDGEARPLEGVEIRASCGWGTLRPTGETVSDQQGKYTLRFGPGMRMPSDDGRNAGTQAATILLPGRAMPRTSAARATC